MCRWYLSLTGHFRSRLAFSPTYGYASRGSLQLKQFVTDTCSCCHNYMYTGLIWTSVASMFFNHRCCHFPSCSFISLAEGKTPEDAWPISLDVWSCGVQGKSRIGLNDCSSRAELQSILLLLWTALESKWSRHLSAEIRRICVRWKPVTCNLRSCPDSVQTPSSLVQTGSACKSRAYFVLVNYIFLLSPPPPPPLSLSLFEVESSIAKGGQKDHILNRASEERKERTIDWHRKWLTIRTKVKAQERDIYAPLFKSQSRKL